VADLEAQAKAVLTEMQVRLSHGPHSALGIDHQNLTPQVVRTAFLNLTKQFHPARFGRLSNELQRMSNEVFLGIKSAHETLLRGLGTPLRGRLANPSNQSGGLQTPMADGTKPQPRATSPASGAPQPAIPRTLTPTKHGVGMTTGKTPPFGTRVTAQRPGTPPQTPPVHPPTSPPTVRVGAPLQRPTTPRIGSPPIPVAMPDQDTQRGTGNFAPLAKPAPAFDERAELQLVLDALAAKQWGQAKGLLNGLAARVPASKQYRALIAYTRGREAQAANRGEDAVQEFQRALQLDPDLQQAKSAMGELLRRR
jgi:hypothetical protein